MLPSQLVMSLRSILVLLKLPLDLVIVVLKYYIFGGLRFRKYNRDFVNCLRLTVYRRCLKVDIMDGTLVGPYSNEFLIRKIVPFITRQLVKGLPGYGQKYGKNCYWLVKQPDRKASDPIIIFSHGGGYFIQTMPSQIQSVVSIYKLLDAEKQKKTSVLFLDYKLVSQGYPFPHQLHQLHEDYAQLVREQNNNIILMGDSAGGHLSIALTRYLEGMPQPQVFPSKLILVSPWVNMCPVPSELMQGSSWFDNEHADLITKHSFSSMKDLGHLLGSEHPMSLLCSPGGNFNRSRADWETIPNFSDPKYDVFLILGEDESFRDDITGWARYALDVDFYTRKYGQLSTQVDREKHEFHRRGVAGLPNVCAYAEPIGVHDAIFYFEHDVAWEVMRSEKRGIKLNVGDVSLDKYYGITRLVKFLNETL